MRKKVKAVVLGSTDSAIDTYWPVCYCKLNRQYYKTRGYQNAQKN